MAKRNSKKADTMDGKPERPTGRLGSIISKKTKRSKCNLRPETIVITGSARLPEDVAAKDACGCVTIELEVDLADKAIVDISCTSVPTLGEKILRNSLLGNEIAEGIEEAITQLDGRFFNVAKRAVIAALEDVYRCYKKSLKKAVSRNIV